MISVSIFLDEKEETTVDIHELSEATTLSITNGCTDKVTVFAYDINDLKKIYQELKNYFEIGGNKNERQ